MGRLLNPTGRTTLIKSTSWALPIYAMCAIVLPKGTLNTLAQKDGAFLKNARTGNARSHGTWSHDQKPKVAWGSRTHMYRTDAFWKNSGLSCLNNLRPPGSISFGVSMTLLQDVTSGPLTI